MGPYGQSYGHMFDLANTEAISCETTKGGRLLKEAWLSDEHSINWHIDLLPAYQTLRRWEKQHCDPQRRRLTCLLQDRSDGITDEVAAIPGEDSRSAVYPEYNLGIDVQNRLIPRGKGGQGQEQLDSSLQDWDDGAAGEMVKTSMGGGDGLTVRHGCGLRIDVQKWLGTRGGGREQKCSDSYSLQDWDEGITGATAMASGEDGNLTGRPSCNLRTNIQDRSKMGREGGKEQKRLNNGPPGAGTIGQLPAGLGRRSCRQDGEDLYGRRQRISGAPWPRAED